MSDQPPPDPSPPDPSRPDPPAPYQGPPQQAAPYQAPAGGYPPPPAYPTYPQAPYAPTPYPGSPYGAPPPKSHTTRNVLLIVGLVVLLFCGGFVALIGIGVSKAKDSINGYDNYTGGPNRPITVSVGRGFEIHGMQYSDGWRLVPGADYDGVLTGLTATNDRPNKSSRSVSLDVKFLRGTTILAEVLCTSGATDIGYGQSKALSCSSSDTVPRSYDTITVNDSYGDFDY